MSNSKTCLVTGGAGFIGSNLVKKLYEEGWTIDIVDDLSSGKLLLLKWAVDVQSTAVPFRDFFVLNDKISFFFGSFDDPAILNKIKSKCYDVIFHQAAIPRVVFSVEQPALTNQTNVGSTVALFEAAVGNVRRIVFASSSSVYGDVEILPTTESLADDSEVKSPYALQKKIGEQYARLFCSLYDIDIVCLRYFNVFGPGQYADTAYSTAVSAWCNAIKNNLPLRSDGDGSQSRDMCYVDNVVQANILAAAANIKFNGQAFNVACGDSVTNREILEFLKSRHPNITVNDAPWRAGDIMHTQADLELSKSVLGYEPKVKFWEGLELTMRWWRI